MNITARMRGPLAMKLRFQPGMKGEKGDAGDAATVAVGTVTTGAPGSPAAVTNVGTSAAAILDFDIPQGGKGDAGDNGWVPELATVTDGARRVHQVVDWFGGTGTKPATGDYVGAAGLTPTIGAAVDIRGPAGTATIPDGDKGDITTSTGGDVWQINAGAVGTTELADKAATNAKLADMATARFKGRATAGSGAPEDLTGAQAAALLDPAAVKTLIGVTTAGDALLTAATVDAQRTALAQRAQLITAGGVGAAVANVEITIPTGFEAFDLDFRNLASTASSYLMVQVKAGGVWYASSFNYSWTQHFASTAAPGVWHDGSGGAAVSSAIMLAASANANLNYGRIRIHPGDSISNPSLDAGTSYGQIMARTVGYLGLTGRIEAIRLLFSAGNVGAGATYELTGLRR